MNLRERAGLVATVSSALARGEHTLAVLPDLIRQMLETDAWKEFETKLGQHVTYERFEEFVENPPLAGLGASIELVRRIVKDDPVARNKLDEVLQRTGGGDQRSEKARAKITVNIVNGDSVERPQGNSKDRALRHLREKRPDLHSRVLAGELSAHAAMREAKFRPPTMTVTLDSPKSATTLITRASPEFINELRRHLCDRQTT